MDTRAPDRTETSSGFVGIAEAFAGLHLDFGESAVDLPLHAGRELSSGFEVGETRLGRNREARRDGNAGAGHLSGAGTLAAEQIAHRLGALAEQVDPLVVGG